MFEFFFPTNFLLDRSCKVAATSWVIIWAPSAVKKAKDDGNDAKGNGGEEHGSVRIRCGMLVRRRAHGQDFRV